MSLNVVIALLLIAIGGAAIALQAPTNARLAQVSGSPILAAAISFGVGFVALSALTLLRDGSPIGQGLATLPWWAWTGGLFGSIYVAAAAWSVSQIGVVTMVAALILGQMGAALALDAIRAFGLTVHEIS
ncbi:MAG: DMT family transporter [Pseudomonadota bacterium]